MSNYSLAACASQHPSPARPYQSLFNKQSLESIARRQDCAITVYAPVPIAPPVGPYSEFNKVPKHDSYQEYEAIRPRYPYILPKRLFFGLTGDLFKIFIGRQIGSERVDVFHGCHVYPDGFGLTGAADEYDTPLTTTVHGYYLNNFSSLPPGVANRVKEALNQSDHVFCVSDALNRKANAISDNNSISTNPIGTNPEKFPTGQKEKLREKYSISDETIVVLFCGQFIRRKGLGDIINNFENLPVGKVSYLFMGHGGELTEELKKTVSRSKVQAQIYYQVNTTQLREIFTISDLLLAPSYQEGRPMVIYEAMASETAVLATRIEGINEQVIDMETGMLIEPGDTYELIGSLNRLISNRDMLKEMGKAGKERLLKKRWTLKDHAERIVRTHKTLLAGHT